MSAGSFRPRADRSFKLTTTLRKAYVEVTLPKKYAGDVCPLTTSPRRQEKDHRTSSSAASARLEPRDAGTHSRRTVESPSTASTRTSADMPKSAHRRRSLTGKGRRTPALVPDPSDRPWAAVSWRLLAQVEAQGPARSSAARSGAAVRPGSAGPPAPGGVQSRHSTGRWVERIGVANLSWHGIQPDQPLWSDDDRLLVLHARRGRSAAGLRPDRREHALRRRHPWCCPWRRRASPGTWPRTPRRRRRTTATRPAPSRCPPPYGASRISTNRAGAGPDGPDPGGEAVHPERRGIAWRLHRAT